MNDLTPGQVPNDGARIVPVRRRGPVEPAALVAVAVIVAVVTALWKPWGASAPATAQATGTPGASAAANAHAHATASATSNAIRASVGPAPRPPVAPGPLTTPVLVALDGLDLMSMGSYDSHATWGVAAAYVTRDQVMAAERAGTPTVAPAVTWTADRPSVLQSTFPSETPGASPAGPPTLNAPDSVAVAIAVTWPAGFQPRDVVLAALGTPPSVQGGSGRGRAPGPVPLVSPVPELERLTPAGLAGSNPLDHVDWQLLSGTFFLPDANPPAAPTGWLASGWTAGPYAFVVTGSDGRTVTLPFSIGP